MDPQALSTHKPTLLPLLLSWKFIRMTNDALTPGITRCEHLSINSFANDHG